MVGGPLRGFGAEVLGAEVLGAEVLGNVELASPNRIAQARFRLRVLRPQADGGACIDEEAPPHQEALQIRARSGLDPGMPFLRRNLVDQFGDEADMRAQAIQIVGVADGHLDLAGLLLQVSEPGAHLHAILCACCGSAG
jgi:hypothetical protein